MLSRASRLDEHTIVDLEKSQQLQDFSGLGGDLIDTKMWIRQKFKNQIRCYLPPDTDNEVNLGLSGDIEVACRPGSTLQTDLLLLIG